MSVVLLSAYIHSATTFSSTCIRGALPHFVRQCVWYGDDNGGGGTTQGRLLQPLIPPQQPPPCLSVGGFMRRRRNMTWIFHYAAMYPYTTLKGRNMSRILCDLVKWKTFFLQLFPHLLALLTLYAAWSLKYVFYDRRILPTNRTEPPSLRERDIKIHVCRNEVTSDAAVITRKVYRVKREYERPAFAFQWTAVIKFGSLTFRTFDAVI